MSAPARGRKYLGLPLEMPRQIIANTAAVATGHPLGAAAGLEGLRDGGNAIDAAVATMLAMCVVVPGSVGLGGYGGSAVKELTPAAAIDSFAQCLTQLLACSTDQGRRVRRAHTDRGEAPVSL